MIIIVTGTPGTGKTKLAKALAKELKHTYIDVNDIINIYMLKEGFDRKRQTYIVDEKKLNKVLISLFKKNKNLIIDSHLSHYLPKKHIDLCVITKTELKELQKRLVKRRYPKAKVRENLEAEIFNICLLEAMEKKHNIFVVDTTNTPVQKLVNQIKNATHTHTR